MNDQIILIADDDVVVHESLSIYLRNEGYEILNAYDGLEALRLAENNNVSLCVLDVMMPGLSGLEVCRELRKNTDISIIMLTAKGEEIDRVLGLEIGADDYIVKPFSPREVIARIRAVLRRSAEKVSQETPTQVRLDRIMVDIGRYVMTVDDKPVMCTPKEIELLFMFVSSPGVVFTRAQLLNNIWGFNFVGETRTVDTHIKRIRAKLEEYGLGWSIKTIYGVGYKLEQT